MNAKFHRKLLKHYLVIDQPGTYMVKVANSVLPQHLIDDDHPRYIVNLRANTEENLVECLNILGLREECYWSEISHLSISGVIWDNDVDDLIKLPVKGENVIVTYDYNEDKVLQCKSITLIPRETLKNFNPKLYSKTTKILEELMFKT